jgi:hypothetical protein
MHSLHWLFGDDNLVTPGVKAEVKIILSDNGMIGIYHSKLAPEDNPSAIYGTLLMRWLAMLSGLGVTLDFTTTDGRVIPLVRPSSEARERAG